MLCSAILWTSGVHTLLGARLKTFIGLDYCQSTLSSGLNIAGKLSAELTTAQVFMLGSVELDKTILTT